MFSGRSGLRHSPNRLIAAIFAAAMSQNTGFDRRCDKLTIYCFSTTKTTMAAKTNLDQLCINTIRTLSLDAVQKANSGHPGLPLGMAPAAYVLWTKFLRHNPRNPKWFGRDRFLLTAGHGSMLLYSLLHLTGYDLPMEELKRFRQLHSKTPGHPENILTPGVEITTGPLGQGFANGVGMGIAQAHLAATFNRQDFRSSTITFTAFARTAI